MLLSIFTPTNNPVYLLETYNSLLSQKGEYKFEWVIVPNAGITVVDIPEQIRHSCNVRIIQAPDTLQGIGALKNFCCENCIGDVFIELDHDDILTADAFEEIHKAYLVAPNGFYYSDFINVRSNGSCETYSVKHGWLSYGYNIDKKKYNACRSFIPNARSLYSIYYAPNHVRVWSKEAYIKTKGHDPSLFVGDDHDLVCRTYLAKVPFVWIDKPIYIYRRGNNNSFVKYGKTIKQQQEETGNKYIYDLIAEECRRSATLMLDLGKEEQCPANFTAFDLVSNGVSSYLEKYSANSAGCIRVVDVLQHISRNDIVALFNEFYRILTPGGWLVCTVPVITDKTAPSCWNPHSFSYFTERQQAKKLTGFTGKFQRTRLFLNYQQQEEKITYIQADMCALKGQRQPGICNI